MQVKVAKEWRDVVLQQNKNQTMKERTNEKHLVYHRNKMTNLFFLLFLQQGTNLHRVLLPEVWYPTWYGTVTIPHNQYQYSFSIIELLTS